MSINKWSLLASKSVASHKVISRETPTEWMCQGKTMGLHGMISAIVKISDGRIMKIRHAFGSFPSGGECRYLAVLVPRLRLSICIFFLKNTKRIDRGNENEWKVLQINHENHENLRIKVLVTKSRNLINQSIKEMNERPTKPCLGTLNQTIRSRRVRQNVKRIIR